MATVNLIFTHTTEHLAAHFAPDPHFRLFLSEKNKDQQRYFPDGEIYVCFPNLEQIKGRVIIIHSGFPQVNSGLQELEMILALLQPRKKQIDLEIFFTYFPYARQDNIFRRGEINAARFLLDKLIHFYRVNKIYLCDPHFANKKWVNNYPLEIVKISSLLQEKARQDFPEIIFLSPDQGGSEREGLPGARKERRSSFEVHFHYPPDFQQQISARTIGVVDDLLQTGGTLSRFGQLCLQCGAQKLIAVITHGVLAEGIKRVQSIYSHLYLANTINQPAANFDISPHLKKIFRA